MRPRASCVPTERATLVAIARAIGELSAAPTTAVFVHRGALSAPFFADDWLFLEVTRGRGLVAAMLARDPLGNYFRPLGRAAWFWALGHASGESAAAFHGANLALFLIAIALLWALARRVAGDGAAAIAAAILALTSAADVPVLWACGAQDLLAVTLALAALLAAAYDRRVLACVLLVMAPLAKETVALTCIPALLLARRAGEPWRETLRRAWCYPAATLVWALMAAYALTHARAGASGLALSPWGPLAAAAGIVRTAFGLEWASDALPFLPVRWPSADVLAALLAVTLAVGFFAPGWPQRARERSAPPQRGKRRGAMPAQGARDDAPAGAAAAPGVSTMAIAWIVAGTLPVAAVAPIWSAYYLLFAMAGVALLAGLYLARLPRGTATLAVVALGIAAHQARAVQEFATAPSEWSRQSHVNRFYLERGMRESARVIAELRAAVPTLEPNTTVLLAGIPAWCAVQTGNGPVLRGVYRDSTLRSYYLTQFDPAMLARGPVRLVYTGNDRPQLTDHTREPGAWSQAAYGMLLEERIAAADAALRQSLVVQPGDLFALYGYLWTAYGLGDRARADSLARRQQLQPRAGADAVVAEAKARLAARDSVHAIVLLRAARQTYAYDAPLHALAADVMMQVQGAQDEGAIEAFAARVLAPEDGEAWRRWAYVQMVHGREQAALASLARYERLAPAVAGADAALPRWRELLQARMPGGTATQAALRSP